MGTASDVLRVARGELGNTSGKKYWDFYFNGSMSYANGSSTPYCACFVSWVLSKAGVKAPGIPAAYCPYICRDGGKAGKTVNKYHAQPGDIVLFDWNSDGLSDHVGIVESNQGTYVQTIEGNTNGGVVARRTRYFSSICHVVRPYYTTKAEVEKLDVDGWAGPLTITALQKALKVPEDRIDGVLSGQSVAYKKYFDHVWSCEWSALGSYTVERLQEKLFPNATSVTGLWDWNTSLRLQTKLIEFGYSCGDDGADGYFGHYSCCALQRALNDNKLNL